MTDVIPVLEVSADHFAPYIGETFYYGDQPLTLVHLEHHPKSTLPRARRTGFSLLLRAQHSTDPEPGLRPLRHQHIELAEPVTLNRIATPVDYIEPGATENPAFYEAIFN